MAESLIALTEGSGAKNLHTNQRVIGVNTVEDQVVVLGEQYLASYVASPTVSGAKSLATANAHVFQIMAGASLKVRIRRIEVFQNGLATTAQFATFSLLRLTTAGTGGTAESVSGLDTTDPAAGATCMTLPTVKGTIGVNLDIVSAYLVQTAGASTQFTQPIYVWDSGLLRTKPLTIASGAANGVALQCNTAVAAATVYFRVWLDESNF